MRALFGEECEAGSWTTIIKWNQKMRFGGELPGPGFLVKGF